MPIRFHILPARDAVYVQANGVMTLEDNMDSFAEYLAHPDFRPGQTQIVDLSRMSDNLLDFETTRTQLASATAFYDSQPVNTLSAIWAPSDLAFGMSRIYEAIAENSLRYRARVFRDEAETLACAGRSEPSMQALLDLFHTTG